MVRTASQALAAITLLVSFSLLIGCGGGGSESSESAIPRISVVSTEIPETADTATVTVTLSEPRHEIDPVNYSTADDSAAAGIHYVSKSGSVTFTAGQTSQKLSIKLVNGRDTSTIKTFVVLLSNPSNAVLSDAQAQISLLNTEHSAMFNNPAYSANWGTKGVFTQANSCASCHTGTPSIMNHNSKDVSPVTEWKHSVMAHSLNDPFFNAALEEETHIFADKKVFIENTCLRCHAPMAYTHAHQNIELLTPDSTGLLVNGGYTFEQAMTDPHAREGVACTACHQIQDVNLGQIESMSGNYTIKSQEDNNGVEPVIFGPFTNPIGRAMQNNTQYTPAYAAHLSTSAHCATCHNLYTPSLDLAGELVMIGDKVAQFPEQAPYWEWLNSRYPTDGKNCQTCHMPQPEPGYTTPISSRPTSSTARPNANDILKGSVYSSHEMVGGNTYLLTLLKTYMETLGIADKTTESGFESKIEESRSLLHGAATLEIGNTSITGDTFTVPITITNQAGHKLPTSYPSRRMWVHFTVTDTNGTTIFESGAVDEKGRIAKDANFTAVKCLNIIKTVGFDSITDGCYEPHRDTINNPSQVAIYESVLGDVNQDITHVLLHGRQYLKDNRIPPQGWTLANQHTNPVDSNIKDDGIVGLATDDANFAKGANSAGSDGTDTLTYQVDISSGTAPYTVKAELLYQTVKPSFVYVMHADAPEHGKEESYVRRFKQMYEETPPIVETLVSTTATHP